METYFRSTDDSNGGMICEGEASMDDVFDKMKDIHQESFQELGGEYIRRRNETTCAIRLPPNTFFEVLETDGDPLLNLRFVQACR